MPLIAKGRYYFELPWPKRNLGKSADAVPRRRSRQVPEQSCGRTACLAETLLARR